MLKVENIVQKFAIMADDSIFKRKKEKQYVHAINDVSLEIKKGETLCVVGESGCGKSTLARVVMGLINPTLGEVYYDNQRIDNLEPQQRRAYCTKMQMIFQNPYASLNSRMTVDKMLREPLQYHHPELSKVAIKEQVHRIMHSVGMDPTWGKRYPHEFSGGQRQRISIARALMLNPEFIVADEPISALDVSIQAQILNLLMEAQESHSLTYLFITHDLSVVKHFGIKVAVMYLGKLCELAETNELFDNPQHPYTQALLSAIPKLKEGSFSHNRLQGEVSTPINLPTGCVLHKRCSHANERCKTEIPVAKQHRGQSIVACHAIEEGRL